jgi:carbon storage regulator
MEPMLILIRGKDEQIVIGEGEDKITIRVLSMEHGKVRLGFEAPRNILILRSELVALSDELEEPTDGSAPD